MKAKINHETHEECCLCGKPVLKDKMMEVELSNTDGCYYKKLPEGHESQGCFAIGPECIKKLIN